MKKKIRTRRNADVIAERLEMVKKTRSGVMPLEKEILLELGFTREEIAWAVNMSSRQVLNWSRKGWLKPVGSLGNVKVYAGRDVIGMFV